MQEKLSSIQKACRGSRTLGPKNTISLATPPLPQVQHPYYTVQICQFVDYIYMSLWLILLQCKWMRLNQDDRIRLCSQNSQNGNRYDYVAKTPGDVELENDVVWKLVVSRPRLAFSDTLESRRIFLENFESQCRVHRSGARRCERRAHRDRKLFLHSNLL